MLPTGDGNQPGLHAEEEEPGWLVKKILGGFAFGLGFVGALVVAAVAYQEHGAWLKLGTLTLPSIQSFAKMVTAVEDVPESYGAEKAHMIYQKGYNFRYGNGVNKNNEEAAKYFTQASDLGDMQAQEELAFMYRENIGVTRDYAKSFELFKKAAEQGSMYAHEALGRAYLMGYSVPINNELAYKEYKLAADNGRGYAMGQLGWMYEKGLYVERDRSQAMEWYEKGKKNGDDYSTMKVRDGF